MKKHLYRHPDQQTRQHLLNVVATDKRTNTMNEHMPANYLGFIKEQIKSHSALLVEHQKICTALKTLLASHSNTYRVSMTEIHLMKVITHANNASTLNESLLNALTALVDASKRFKNPVNV